MVVQLAFYLQKTNDSRWPTKGALDMGGASTQITFEPSPGTALNPNFSSSLQLYGEEYEVNVDPVR